MTEVEEGTSKGAGIRTGIGEASQQEALCVEPREEQGEGDSTHLEGKVCSTKVINCTRGLSRADEAILTSATGSQSPRTLANVGGRNNCQCIVSEPARSQEQVPHVGPKLIPDAIRGTGGEDQGTGGQKGHQVRTLQCVKVVFWVAG